MAFRQVVKTFFNLPKKQQEDFLRDLYGYSPDMKIVVESKLGLQADFQKYLTEMHRETIDKIYRKGTPGTPNGRVVNNIITKALKAQVSLNIMLELEQLAFRGFIEFLNEYGGGPDNFDDIACKHLEAYLTIVKTQIYDKNEQEKLYEEVRICLKKLNNMITDYVDEAFETITGISVRR